MRVAVALPSLAAGSLPARDLRAVLEELGRAGMQLEGFAEWPDRWSGSGLQAFHYLRVAERHAASPFATGLYPLGRDFQPYEAALIMAVQFPAVVWVLDPVLHHLAVGGIAVRGRWREYGELVERAHPGRGEAVLSAVRDSWGTRTLYRRYDPLPWMLREQAGWVAATDDIARGLRRHGFEAPVIPLAGAGSPRPRGTGNVRHVLVLAFHYGDPMPTLHALRNALAASPGLSVSALVPDFVLENSIGPLADKVGLRDRIRWLPLDDVRVMQELDRVDAVAHLREDPVVGERALLQEAAARSRPLIVLRAGGAHGVPDGAAVQVEPGRGYEASLTAALRMLCERDDLSASASVRAAAWAAARPGPAECAASLAEQLRLGASSGFRERPVAAPVWARLATHAAARVQPRVASPGVSELMASRLRIRALPGLFEGKGKRPGARHA